MDHFQQMHHANDAFSFFFTQKNLMFALRENRLLTKCLNFQEKFWETSIFFKIELKTGRSDPYRK